MTTATTSLIDRVDNQDFRGLFIADLGWSNPDIRKPVTYQIDGVDYTFTQVAGYKGMRIWHCPQLPSRPVQRQLDVLLGIDSHERLVIFTDSDGRQEWRWPRRAQLGSANAKLVVHEYEPGDRASHLSERLGAIRIDFNEQPSLVEILSRMRLAFDQESEKASVAAARLMGTLYRHLDKAGAGEHESTLLLARLLFLMFGDDSDMWKTSLFGSWLAEHTTSESLHSDLLGLFEVLDQPEGRRTSLTPGDPRAAFRYINGGLFADALRLPVLPRDFREDLLSACEFDWSVISPAVFGSMFQTVKDKAARHPKGEHYTDERSILRTLNPLFLDEYRERLQKAWNDKGQLTRLHKELGRLRIMDPACGCGNFLIVAYRELRALELDIMKRRRDLDLESGGSRGGDRSQTTINVADDILVTVDHFYGIEISEWPARIAETAMLLVDHLANQHMALEFGLPPDRLPIRIAPTIVVGNAIHENWAEILPPSDDVIIVGNPPFKGQGRKKSQEVADAEAAWGARYHGYLDYVTSWYAKALDYFGDLDGRWAYVSTNSVCQGFPVAYLWSPILEAGWRARFAHRSLRWETESAARDQAAVHVSILGFDRRTAPRPSLWTYGEDGRGEPVRKEVRIINPYLVDAPTILVWPRKNADPLAYDLPRATKGSSPTDGGGLLVEKSEYATVAADPIAAKYLRRFIGADELVKGKERWCLWLDGADEEDMRRSEVLRSRLDRVASWRSQRSKAATRKRAETPHLFAERRQPDGMYLALPRHVGENRRYYTPAVFQPKDICGDANSMVVDSEGLALAILSSTAFITWMRTVGGRLESRLRFSNEFTYNNFPLPRLSTVDRHRLIEASGALLRARADSGLEIAAMYDGNRMPIAIKEIHDEIDRIIDSVFGYDARPNHEERQRDLLVRYRAILGGAD